MTSRSKADAQMARAATTLGIGVAGLVIVRLFVQGLPMFQEAGWIVKGKLTVVAAAVIVVDAMLISILVGFAIQLRACLQNGFPRCDAIASRRGVLGISQRPSASRCWSGRNSQQRR